MLPLLVLFLGVNQTAIEKTAVIVSSKHAACSGVLISFEGRPTVLTAKHCASRGAIDVAEFTDGSMAPTKALCTSSGRDLTLLRIPGAPPRRTAPLSPADPLPRTAFVTYGRSQEVDWAWGEGYVSGPPLATAYGSDENPTSDGVQWVLPMVCLGCDSGGSGGALFNGPEVIGLFVAQRQSGSVGYAIPPSVIRQFLRDCRREGK